LEIIYFGSLKTDYIKKGIERFEKWLKPYTKLKFKNLPSGGDIHRNSREKILLKEAKTLFSHIDEDSYLVVMSEHAKGMNSEKFSKLIEESEVYSRKLCFIIGGYLGFDDSVYKRANMKLSLSDMTFTHEMAILLLTEQIYRGYKIMRGEKYHY